MEQIGEKIALGVFAIFLLIASGWDYEEKSPTLEQCEYYVSEYKASLEEANYNIAEANRSIDDAQSAAWEDYNEMGEALDRLEKINPIRDPFYE